MDAAKRKEIAAHLEGLGFKPAPGPTDSAGIGAVHCSTPDGVYFNLMTTSWDIQLLVVGAMMGSPVEYAERISDGVMLLTPSSYWMKEATFLPMDLSAPQGLRQIMIERGFISIILRNYADEDRPGSFSPPEPRVKGGGEAFAPPLNGGALKLVRADGIEPPTSSV